MGLHLVLLGAHSQEHAQNLWAVGLEDLLVLCWVLPGPKLQLGIAYSTGVHTSVATISFVRG